jgi:branched-chain amino acid transport system ATP-binding protein
VKNNQEALLDIRELVTGYGKAKVIDGVSINVFPGEFVVLIGHNGAGKTTTLSTIFGLIHAWTGQIYLNGKDITNSSTADNVKHGISLLLGRKSVFPDLTVEENLNLAGYTVNKEQNQKSKSEVYNQFPILKSRNKQNAGTLSGGEQRMLSLGMALMTKPQLLLLDEPSLGLAPLLVEQFMRTLIETVKLSNLSVLLVEQNIDQALNFADRVYVLRSGKIITEETGERMRKRGKLWDLF